MLRLSIRAGWLLAALAASAATFSLAQMPAPGGPPGQPGAAGPRRGDILDFASIQNRWHWLVLGGEEVELLSSAPGERATQMTALPGLTEVALDEESIWLLQRQGPRGTLLKMPRAGGTATPVVSNLEAPASLVAVNKRVFWIETRAPALPGLFNIPAAESRNVVRMLSEDGGVSDLGSMVGGKPAVDGDLLGMAHLLCARLQRLGSTELYLIDLRRPALQRMAVEEGPQQGLVYHRGFIWTAPSEEAAEPTSQRCLRRSAGSGRTTSITDWLPANGQLLRLGAQLYYADFDLYRIPDAPGEPVYVAGLPPGVITSDGDRVVHLDARTGPRVVPLTQSDR